MRLPPPVPSQPALRHTRSALRFSQAGSARWPAVRRCRLLNSRRADTYREILSYRQYPRDLFTGSPATLTALREAISKK
jgi:hypothetical protein